MASTTESASHCFAFEQDFIGNWRCIPLCVRRKLDLSGVKLKLNHWLALTQDQRQQLVDWPDTPEALQDLRDHLRQCTASMPDGRAKDLDPVTAAPWQQADQLPQEVVDAAAARRLMSRTGDALCTSWSGAAAGPRPAVLPSVEHHSKRAGFNCASTCTTIHELLMALDGRVVPQSMRLQRDA